MQAEALFGLVERRKWILSGWINNKEQYPVYI